MYRGGLKNVAGYYQYRDRLNSSVVEANELGQVISYEEYYPYGRSAYRAASSGVDLSLKRYRFTGKERDEETGLDYFGVRYYASWLGRWTSGDPGGFVDGLNMYRYVRNNPINGIDREGYSTEPIENSMEDEPTKTNTALIRIEGDTAIFQATIFTFGSEATPEHSQELACRIETTLNEADGYVTIDGKKYKARFEIEFEIMEDWLGGHENEEYGMKWSGEMKEDIVSYMDGDVSVLENNYFYMASESEGRVTSMDRNFAVISINDLYDNQTTVVHEFVHGLGWYDVANEGNVDKGAGARHDLIGIPTEEKELVYRESPLGGFTITYGTLYAPSGMTPRGTDNAAKHGGGAWHPSYLNTEGGFIQIEPGMRVFNQRILDHIQMGKPVDGMYPVGDFKKDYPITDDPTLSRDEEDDEETGLLAPVFIPIRP